MKRKKENKQHKTEATVSVHSSDLSIPVMENSWIFLLGIIVISILVYLPVFQSNFINWDDEVYIRDNPLVYAINLKEIFSTFVASNYHPLTILLLAIEYHFFKLNATGYHTVNLLLHLFNIILVFNVIILLSKNSKVALVAALFFGIHPIHVESVAWAAELKDLLYAFFFLLSYLFYLKYLTEHKNKFYVFAVILFLLSLLSKAMAASLPIVFLLTDYYMARKINLKTIIEKLPFFILALILGVVAVIAQKSSGATDMIVFPFLDRILFAIYGFITYLYKLILPLNLSAFYPYPVKPGQDIPLYYFAYLTLFIGLIAAIYYSLKVSKKIIFGVGFFSITVFLVLQLLPVGGAIMADRYCYIPSIGIFYLAGEALNWLWNIKRIAIAIILTGVFALFFSVKSYTRNLVWNNSFSLWDDVIIQYQTVPQAYNNRGLIYKADKKQELAISDFSKAISLDEKYFESYINRGNLLRDNNRFEEALSDYNKVVALKPYFYKAYINRGILFLNTKRYDEALKDFNLSSKYNPGFADTYYHIGLVFYNQKRYDEAIINYNKAIQLKSSYAEAYFSRGVSEYYSGKNDIACNDLKKGASLGYQPPADVLKLICKY